MQTPTDVSEAVIFAKDLMAGDPANFKAGYTLENAAIAVAEVFGFDRAVIEARLRSIENSAT